MTGADAALAARARALAAAALPRTPGRRAADCLVIALATTGSAASARKALEGVVPGDVREAALRLLGTLTRDAAT